MRSAEPYLVDDRAMNRAAKWLSDMGASDIGPVPLLAARLDLRWRLLRWTWPAFAGVLPLQFAPLFLLPSDQWAARTAALGCQATAYVLTLVFIGLIHRVGVREDQAIGAGLRRRVAHPTPPDWRVVVGRWRLTATGAVYLGAATFVAITAHYAPPSARTSIIIALLGLSAMALAKVAVIGHVLRRPALATDATSLAVDDAMRARDARGVLLPLLAPLLTVHPLLSVVPTTPRWLAVGGLVLMTFAVVVSLPVSLVRLSEVTS